MLTHVGQMMFGWKTSTFPDIENWHRKMEMINFQVFDFKKKVKGQNCQVAEIGQQQLWLVFLTRKEKKKINPLFLSLLYFTGSLSKNNKTKRFHLWKPAPADVTKGADTSHKLETRLPAGCPLCSLEILPFRSPSQHVERRKPISLIASLMGSEASLQVRSARWASGQQAVKCKSHRFLLYNPSLHIDSVR